MTRKDYEKIASAMFDRMVDLRPSDHGRKVERAYKAQHKALCNNVADVLACDNERFDRERFLRACGVERD